MIRELINEYLELYPEEVEGLLAAKKLSEKAGTDEEKIFDRKNSDGHFTASAFILCPSLGKILLLKHKSLGILLQPGGHIEKEDATPFAAALRELEEETGCLDLEKINYIEILPDDPLVPFHIDTHKIPENPQKGEPAHLHHDFGYLFETNEIQEIKIDQNESDGILWVDLEEFYKQPHFAAIAPKVKKFLAENRV